MGTRLRLIYRTKPVSRLRQLTEMRTATFIIGALTLNLFVITYIYFNLGTSQKAYAGTMTAVASGNWTSPSTWSAGRVPQDNDSLTIPFGKTVSVDIVTPSYNHLLITVNGTLFFMGGKKIIMCEGMVVVSLCGLLNSGNAGSKFEICGSFLWDGASPGDGPLSFGGFTGATLPVNLVYFKALPENNKVNVQWETASQVNCDYFSVERSEDGVNFSSIVNMKGKGNSNRNDVYDYIDADALEGTSYYRLIEVDFDGKSQTFNTVSVTYKPTPEITVYPNPVAAGSTATVEIPFTNIDSQVEVSMMNIEGKKIFSKTFGKNTGNSSTISFQTEAFPAKGTFLLLVARNDSRTIKKILVQ